MRCRVTGLSLAAAFALVASLAAQSATQAPTATQTTTQTATAEMRDIVLTGCLQRAGDGFTLTNTQITSKVGAPAAAGTSGASAGTATATTGATAATARGTTATATVTIGTATNTAPEANWMVRGAGDLGKHVGHKVELIGRGNFDVKAGATTVTSTADTTATASTAPTRNVEVHTLRMLSATCP